MPQSSTGILAAVVLFFAFAQTGCHVYDFTPRYERGEIDIFDDLFSVSVVDAEHVVAAGYEGSIYWSEDGGRSWHKGVNASKKLLYSISMGDAQHGWAVGQSGTIVRTEDGGKTWKLQHNIKADEGSHLFGVHAIDADTAWAVGEWGSRIRTSDGGDTWVDHSIPVTLNHPQFVWLSAADQAKVRRGEVVYEDVGLTDIYCRPLPSRRCWIVGEFGYIFYSDDLGETWQKGEILGEIRIEPAIFGFNEIRLPADYVAKLKNFAKQIADSQHLNVLIDPYVSKAEVAKFGNPDDPSELFDILSARIDETRAVLEEAGVLFDRMRMPNKPPWDYEDFMEDDPEFLDRYIAGRTADQPMIKVGIIQNPYLFTVEFRDEEDGLISGLGGVILGSRDGGRTWSYEDTGWKQAFFAVASSWDRSVAVGEKGLIRYSSDGGATWRLAPEGNVPPLFTFMRDINFDRRKQVGFIVGQEGMVLRSTDAGNHWVQVLPPESRRTGRI